MGLGQADRAGAGRVPKMAAALMPRTGHGLKNLPDLVHRPMGGLRASVAPVRRRAVAQRKDERTASRLSISEDAMTGQRRSAVFGSISEMAQPQLTRALDEYFALQARLPPSGATAFDPRLTPAWAGVKLPV
jgi:hypothetical protein